MDERPDQAAPFARALKDVLAELAAHATSGLDHAEIDARRARFGRNRLPEAPRKSLASRLASQFKSPLVLTLLAAAGIAVVVGAGRRGSGESVLARFGDALAIVLIVALNALLGVVQEGRAEAALDALQKLESPRARVRRDGQVAFIPSEELVPGDLLELEAGDAVPADARLLETVELSIDEASLTGESTSTDKDSGAVLTADTPLAEQATMVFVGTTVVRGRGSAVVVATGAFTELGKIGALVSGAGNDPTPLERRLDSFGKQVLWICLGVSGALFAWGMVRGARPWHVLLLEGVSFAVAAIPEGLPAITTITLALGMQRMAKKGAIVRRLPAVETLGAATVICTDKTGTLTQNEMTVREVLAGGLPYTVSGRGYDPTGAIQDALGGAVPAMPGPLEELVVTFALCNTATLRNDASAGTWHVVGDPTEGALLTLARKAGSPREDLMRSRGVVREIPFDSDRKRMTTVVKDAEGTVVAHVKGSLETLLPLCSALRDGDGARPLSDADRLAIQAEAERMSAAGLRVLAAARKPVVDDADPESDLVFLGLAAMMDPPRAGVREAIAVCARAGVRAVMITGDHPLTAVAVARELGLWTTGDEALTGPELQITSEADLSVRIARVRVFARTTPEQKLRIVRAFKAAGEVVAMTGDGVNDAPALREAHIGIAMGRSGTDVARQAAAIVITDDNFATIVEAISQGRTIYRNIQKFIFFLLSSNAGLAVAVFATSFSRTWLPLTPLMILWINLVTNGLPALALAIDAPDPKLMQEPPRSGLASLVGARDLLGLAYVGIVMGFAAIAMYAWTYCAHAAGPQGPRTLAFLALGLSPLFHAWSCRSPTESLLRAKPLVSLPLLLVMVVSAAIQLIAVLIPALRPVFRTDALSSHDWTMVLIASIAVVPAVELAKMLSHLARRRAA
ncbi:MAG: cation-translocating P-type ATPase [Byssovorax sp.]